LHDCHGTIYQRPTLITSGTLVKLTAQLQARSSFREPRSPKEAPWLLLSMIDLTSVAGSDHVGRW